MKKACTKCKWVIFVRCHSKNRKQTRKPVYTSPVPRPSWKTERGSKCFERHFLSHGAGPTAKECHTKNSCTKRRCLWRASTDLLNKASHLTAFCVRYSSPHLPVTPVQLMKSGIGWNTSCPVGDNLGLFYKGDVDRWLFTNVNTFYVQNLIIKILAYKSSHKQLRKKLGTFALRPIWFKM